MRPGRAGGAGHGEGPARGRCGPTARPWRWGWPGAGAEAGCAWPRRRLPSAGLGRATSRDSAGAPLEAKGQEPSSAGAPRSSSARDPAPRPAPRPRFSSPGGTAAPGGRAGPGRVGWGGQRRRRCRGEGPSRRGGQERARARLRSAPVRLLPGAWVPAGPGAAGHDGARAGAVAPGLVLGRGAGR